MSTSSIKFCCEGPIANATLNEVKVKTSTLRKLVIYQACASVKNPDTHKYVPGPEDTFGKRVYDFLKRKSPQARQAIYKKVLSLDGAFYKSIKSFISTSGVKMASNVYVLKQIDIKKEFAFINKTNVNSSVLKAYFNAKPTTQFVNGIGVINGALSTNQVVAPIKKVNLNLHEVICVDETNPESIWGIGGDEILVAAVVTDNNNKKTAVQPFKVGKTDFFTDGKKYKFTEPKIITSFNVSLNEIEKRYQATFFLAEEDNGASLKFTDDLSALVQGKDDLLETGIKIVKDMADDANLGDDFESDIAEAGLKEAGDAILEAFEHDIFPSKESHTISCKITGNIKTENIIQEMTFVGHGGTYKLLYSWQTLN